MRSFTDAHGSAGELAGSLESDPAEVEAATIVMQVIASYAML